MADVIEIGAEVRERELRLTSIPMMPSGSRNHLRIRVAFDAEWDGTTKTLVAYRDLSHPYHAPLGLDGTALIPHEVLAEQGVAYLGVFGIAGDQRITSTVVRYGLNEGAITEGLQPSDPTPEMWEKLISAVNEVRQAAESAMRDAQTAAQGAQRSAQAAAGSATQADGAQTAAQSSAQSAGEQANAAATSAQQAQQAQTAAAASATSAQASATEATKQATAAEGAAVRAENAATEVEQSAQQIAGAIDRLAIHDTAAGNPTVIRDGADWQMEGLRVYGQSEQVTTTGANLLDCSNTMSNVGNTEVTLSGNLLTIINQNAYPAVVDIPITLDAGTYYMSVLSASVPVPIYRDGAWFSNGVSDNSKKSTIKIMDGGLYVCRITAEAQSTATVNELMISAKDVPYEPYTGGKPAPSPEYPQEIVSREVSSVVVTGSNLLPPDDYFETATNKYFCKKPGCFCELA